MNTYNVVDLSAFRKAKMAKQTLVVNTTPLTLEQLINMGCVRSIDWETASHFGSDLDALSNYLRSLPPDPPMQSLEKKEQHGRDDEH